MAPQGERSQQRGRKRVAVWCTAANASLHRQAGERWQLRGAVACSKRGRGGGMGGRQRTFLLLQNLLGGILGALREKRKRRGKARAPQRHPPSNKGAEPAATATSKHKMACPHDVTPPPPSAHCCRERPPPPQRHPPLVKRALKSESQRAKQGVRMAGSSSRGGGGLLNAQVQEKSS